MAVIHQGDQILSAACVALPRILEALTSTLSLNTQHRAAIGMTGGTDAVVLVVSEEDGTISIAHRGELKRALEPSEVLAAAAHGFPT